MWLELSTISNNENISGAYEKIGAYGTHIKSSPLILDLTSLVV
jgi:hypothetical protein